MASLMESFQQQYASLIAEITEKIGKIRNSNEIERHPLIKQADKQVEEAHELLEQMELEVRGMQEDRPKYQTQVKSYSAELARLVAELESSKRTDDTSSRDDLFAESTSLLAEQKTRLLGNTEKLEQSTNKLHGGYKILVETEHVGENILNDLHTQRETLTRARDRLRETEDDLGKSSRILSAMIRRIIQNRLILYLVAGAIGFFAILAIYITYQKHR